MAVDWGSTIWLFLPASSPHLEPFLLIAAAPNIYGAATSQASYHLLNARFTIPLVATVALGLARFGDAVHFAYAAALCCWAALS